MGDKHLCSEFKQIYDDWGAAIVARNQEWFERHFADDFLGTAAPWPTLSVTKAQMIGLEQANKVMDVKWLEVTAERFGDVVLANGVVHYFKEEFEPGTAIAEGMPTNEQLSSLVNGKRVLYIGAWRHANGTWQIFDHHMVGVVEGYER